MPRPKHTPEIIIGKLREVEVLVAKGATVAEASRQIGVTEQQRAARWRDLLHARGGTRDFHSVQKDIGPPTQIQQLALATAFKRRHLPRAL